MDYLKGFDGKTERNINEKKRGRTDIQRKLKM
jgi:hypothetical protein